ncbi:MAG: sigma-70 family RNA polymerase sigma factor [Prevotella sp.]|jgi:RNA polymerase sigma-70 factor (ECF subfamily)|nr:sigma-70 family RNA polymerase sigma factor [Prevotella sp.]
MSEHSLNIRQQAKQELLINYYIAHRDELLAYVSSRLGDSDLAEDIVQDVFLKLLTTNKMISEVTMPALVYTIARNLITSYYRRRFHHEEYEHHISRNEEGGTRIDESVFSVQEITERLERGLARLPENCREVYRLHVFGDMKVSEISQQLGEGYKSVENRLGLARKAIRQYLRMYA